MGGRGLTVRECSMMLSKQSSEDQDGVGVVRGQSEGRHRVRLCHFLCHLHDTTTTLIPPEAAPRYSMKNAMKLKGCIIVSHSLQHGT